jgi:uncharacterized membrane protein
MKEKKHKDATPQLVAAALAYILVGIIWYFTDSKLHRDTFVKYHVVQGIILTICWLVVSIGYHFLPWGLGWLASLFHLILFVIGIVGILNALQKNKTPLPIIGKWAQNIKL